MERYYQTTLGTNTKLAAMTTDYMQRVILKGSFKHQMKMLIRAIRAIRLSQGALDPVYEALEKIKFDAQRIPFSRFDFFNLEIHIQALFADSKQNKLDPKLEALLLDIFQLSIDHLEKIYHTPPRADLHPENTLALHDAQELTTCLVIEMMKASYNDPDKFRDLAFKLSQVPYMDQRIGTASRTFSARLREGHGLYFDPFNRY
jgi:hypothetical protein